MVWEQVERRKNKPPKFPSWKNFMKNSIIAGTLSQSSIQKLVT
jgi:hypothetical protein